MEGYRLESSTFLCLSFQGVPRFSRFGSSPTTGPLAGRIPLRCPFSPIFFFQAIEILLFHPLLPHKSPFSSYGQFLAIAISGTGMGIRGAFPQPFARDLGISAAEITEKARLQKCLLGILVDWRIGGVDKVY